MKKVLVSGSFDTVSSQDMRFLHEASKIGELHVDLWSDAKVATVTGKAPKCPFAERQYMMDALRYVHAVTDEDSEGIVIDGGTVPDVVAVSQAGASDEVRESCESAGAEYKIVSDDDIAGYPVIEEASVALDTGNPKVIVTGCYDWFHTGHVRFFEEVSEHGDLYVSIGNDANVELLKGEGHPMFKQDERLYMVQSIKYVTCGMISTGSGWMDAAPEIEQLKPEKYAVNEDGDKPEKRQFCEEHGIEYVILKRVPKDGLTARTSTDLRGF